MKPFILSNDLDLSRLPLCKVIFGAILITTGQNMAKIEQKAA